VILSPNSMLLFSVGFLVLGILLAVSYWSKLIENKHGVTSEMSGLLTFLIGGVVAKEIYWVAIAVAIINLLLLQLKTYLEGIAKRIESHEITTLVKFLLLSAVILPVIPNVELTPFHINPYHTWLIVVAVSSLFYASYLMEKFMKARQSLLLSAVFGGLYSSTATTVVISKKAKGSVYCQAYSGSILIATGMMYLRLAVLLFIFNRLLFDALGGWFCKMALLATLGGYAWMKSEKKISAAKKGMEVPMTVRNPLEVRTAMLFAALFIILIIATELALKYFGNSGMFSLAAIMGTIDIDPFVLGLTQAGGRITPIDTAALAILIATASNNVAKGVYSIIFAGRKTGVQALVLLILISFVSLYAMKGL